MESLFGNFQPATPADWMNAAGLTAGSGIPAEWIVAEAGGLSIAPLVFEAEGRNLSGLRVDGWRWEVVPLIELDGDPAWEKKVEEAAAWGADKIELRHCANGGEPKSVARFTGLAGRLLLTGDGWSESSEGRLFNPLASSERAWEPMAASLAATARGQVIDADVTALLQTGGATPADQLAYALATAVESARKMVDRGISFDRISTGMRIVLPLGGSSFFVEIAKLRALRLLWQTVAEACGGSESHVHIHSRGSRWNKPPFGTRLNIARNAFEGLAAVCGGCDSLETVPHQRDETGRRIALNTQHILREEAWMGIVADPAAGSRLVEDLTSQLVQLAWAEFQEIERLGGMDAALASGRPSKRVEASAALRRRRLAEEQDILVGVNRFKDNYEPPHDPEADRLSSDFEKEERL